MPGGCGGEGDSTCTLRNHLKRYRGKVGGSAHPHYLRSAAAGGYGGVGVGVGGFVWW